MIKEIQEGLRPHKARHLQFQENINLLSVETNSSTNALFPGGVGNC